MVYVVGFSRLIFKFTQKYVSLSDEAKQFLTLTAGGKTVVVVVSHEVDWEASPRQETVVYAGTEKALNATWWGKKVQ